MFKKQKKLPPLPPKQEDKEILLNPDDVKITKTIIEPKTIYSNVYKAKLKGGQVVAKEFQTDYITEQEKQKIKKDLEIVKKVLHPNIILFFGYYENKKKMLGLVSEELQFNLNTVIFQKEKCTKILKGELTFAKKLLILKDITVALSWIHNVAKIPHGNLHDKNILFDKDGVVKLCDFGLEYYQKTKQVGEYYLKTSSPLFAAPEIWTENARPSFKSDMYSLGLIAYEILCDTNDFYDGADVNEPSEIFEAISDGKRPNYEDKTNSGLSELISFCTDEDPSSRPAVESVSASLNLIVINACMTNKDARDFYLEHFNDGNSPLYEISFEDLEWILSKYSLSTISQSDIENFKKFFPENGILTCLDFDLLANLFGDFYKDSEIVSQMIECDSNQWFYHGIDKKTAEGKLSGCPDGTFLIRLSFTDPLKAPFTLTRVSDGKVKHHRIERISKDELQIKVGKTYTASNINELVPILMEKGVVSDPLDELAVQEEY